MSRLLVRSFSISIDGYGAGPDQSLENPLGVGGEELHEWFFHTRTWQGMYGGGGGETGPENDLAQQGMSGFGAWILGRNMFGPVRGPWPDESWKGWWGEDPPYHVPTFVLTHHPRRRFACRAAPSFASSPKVSTPRSSRRKRPPAGRTSGSAAASSTIQQYLQARLIDELHLAIAPVLLGRGENLLGGIDLLALGYECVEHIPGVRAAAHVIIRKRYLGRSSREPPARPAIRRNVERVAEQKERLEERRDHALPGTSPWASCSRSRCAGSRRRSPRNAGQSRWPTGDPDCRTCSGKEPASGRRALANPGTAARVRLLPR